ncbi:MAG: FAD-binding protein, partial [Tenericutes bacterium HGW-Tenericutes-3]
MEISQYVKPKTIEEAYQILSENPKNMILGGGAWLKQSSPIVHTLVDIAQLGLDKITENKDSIEVGALVTLHDLEINPAIKKLGHGFISQSISQVLGVGFRNISTIGGSIAGRYAFSDVLTALLTLNVKLIFFPKREISLEEFLNSKGKVKDILTHIVIKKAEGKGFFKKVSASTLEFATLNVAVYQEQKKYWI